MNSIIVKNIHSMFFANIRAENEYKKKKNADFFKLQNSRKSAFF